MRCGVLVNNRRKKGQFRDKLHAWLIYFSVVLDLLEWLIDWWVYGRQSSPPFFCFAKLLRHWHFLRREHEVYWHARPNFCWRSFLWASGQPGKQPCVRMCWSDPNGKKSLEPEFCKVPNEKFKHFGESISKHELSLLQNISSPTPHHRRFVSNRRW